MRIRLVTVLTLVGAGLLFGPETASAQTCINDVWKAHGNNQNLTCTSGDVKLSAASNINISSGGTCSGGVCQCYAGQPVTFTADFRMDLTADTRYDVGFYIATGTGATQALTGQCSATASLAANTTRPGNFINLDASPDVCGDITGPLSTAAGSHNPLFVTATISGATCPSAEGAKLTLPFATTWRQPGSNDVCAGTGNGSTTNDVYPGLPSKCNTGTLVIDITSVRTSLTVTKTALTTSVPETGGNASYSATVKNDSALAVTLTSLSDDKYGNLSSATNTTCKAPPDGAANACYVGAVIAAGGSCTCTFDGAVPPGNKDGKYTDTVTACGTNPTDPTERCADDDADVSYTDVATAPSLVKTAASNACQIDTTYSVGVNNNSAVDALTINTLTDDVFGNITGAHAAGVGGATIKQVVSTTCGQSPGPGTLPATVLPGNTYSCSFVGRVTSCNATVHDTVTAGTVDADGGTFSPSDDASVSINVQ